MITWEPKMCIGCNARPAVLGTWTFEGFELLHCDQCGTPCDPGCCDVSLSPDAETITALWVMHCAAPDPAVPAFSDAPAVHGTITVMVPHNFSGDESALRADLAQHLEGVAGISRVTVKRADAPPSPDDSRVTLTSRAESERIPTNATIEKDALGVRFVDRSQALLDRNRAARERWDIVGTRPDLPAPPPDSGCRVYNCWTPCAQGHHYCARHGGKDASPETTAPDSTKGAR